MKKISKRILAFVIAMTMMLTAIPVSASKVLVDIPRKASYMKEAPNDKISKTCSHFLGNVKGTKKVSVKSSNNKIAVVKKLPMDDPLMNGCVIQVYPKKSGTVTITVTVNKKAYKCRFTVYNYKNPFASVKIGKYKIAGSKFDKAMRNRSVRYSRLAGKNAKFQVKLKRGWKVSYITYYMKNLPESEMENYTVSDSNVATLKKVRGGAGSSFLVQCHHSKLGIDQVWEIILR